VQDVSLVINFQMAGSIEAYVHRIGALRMKFLDDPDAYVVVFRPNWTGGQAGDCDNVPDQRRRRSDVGDI
jgi:hypothetical protein